MIEPAPTRFEGSIAHLDGHAVIELRGELDLAATMSFSALIAQALTGTPHVIFDMADLTFLDSTGLRCILEVHRNVRFDGSITIRNARAEVAHVLHISGVDAFLTIER